jgi:hypothetical protein
MQELTAVVGQAFELILFIVNMVVAMGLALGIDHSLFIVSRLREERRHGSDTREAIMTVANTATRAVPWLAGRAWGSACNGRPESARIFRRSTRGDGRGWCGIARLRFA